MKVGLFLTNEHPTGSDLSAAFDDQLWFAEAAASGGWESLFTGQHFVSSGTQRTQPIPFLARLAAAAPGLSLGTGIHLFSLGNPVAMAEDFASLDVVSGGRVIAGLGIGYRPEEFAAFGIDMTQRARRFERNLEIARELWSGRPVTVDEEWCRLDEAVIGTRPVQDPLPVWIGGTGPRAIERAGRLADGWIINPAADSGSLADLAPGYRSAALAAGRPSHVAAFREVYCAATDELARETALPHLARKYAGYSSWGQERGHVSDQSLAGPVDEVGRDRFIVGSPETVLAGLRSFRDTIGVDEFILRTDWPGMPVGDSLRSMDLLAREVLPVLRADAVV
ncbi:LLM class flavin-dependent oxidoreductase [Amnibacterium flavum]|uniref:LLM class flavin-dependent oxidoreductase n=1 Tax=Amnibacterium flavum TaxID=2173173 RepID=A0A2V1HSF6_9MICO|nr:LLM class flavin-dependent oxidoreductase [Amnibacterium flavum]PVZ95271.1 LLM class flavin-dependent oxidoreductase [Amnibacterium flavum]